MCVCNELNLNIFGGFRKTPRNLICQKEEKITKCFFFLFNYLKSLIQINKSTLFPMTAYVINSWKKTTTFNWIALRKKNGDISIKILELKFQKKSLRNYKNNQNNNLFISKICATVRYLKVLLCLFLILPKYNFFLVVNAQK